MKTSKQHTVHSDATRLEAVKLAKAGKSPSEIAEQFGVNRTTVFRWVKAGPRKVQAAQGTQAAPLLSDDSAALRARLRELEDENHVLRRAIGIVSRGGR